jgi:hypothetical protein
MVSSKRNFDLLGCERRNNSSKSFGSGVMISFAVSYINSTKVPATGKPDRGFDKTLIANWTAAGPSLP